MDTREIITVTNKFLVEEFEANPAAITPEANMKSTLDLDSLDYIDMVVVIEDNFGFKVKPEEFQAIVSFQDFYNYVATRVQQKELV
ncbi:phosphopantetheine-binding protein [Chitinophaga polysaccharea]|uniref:phosphopantetheine-binding protein n=1 Tax=Chitinophaga polysaccharea TaxID=1293035 RepID=UPI00115A773C|nr:phosphopantetheine-binding protein [Chitinophaga polysaccharea]